MTEKDVVRFWAKVNKDGPFPDPVAYPELKTRCWVWTAGKFSNGYAAFQVEGRVNKAHRIAWRTVHGSPPEDIQVCHKCDNPPCVNPDHLFLGTQLDNMRDKCFKGRQAKSETHGSKTHPERFSRGPKHSEIMFRVAARGDRNGSRIHPESLKRGESNNKAKISANDVLEIRKFFTNNSQNTMCYARKFGLARSTIRRIVLRKIWQHIA